jgi:hypothetical protein
MLFAGGIPAQEANKRTVRARVANLGFIMGFLFWAKVD